MDLNKSSKFQIKLNYPHTTHTIHTFLALSKSLEFSWKMVISLLEWTQKCLVVVYDGVIEINGMSVAKNIREELLRLEGESWSTQINIL